MKSYHVEYGGGIEALSVREHDEPRPGPGQVLVRVRASSLGFREMLVLSGNYVLPVKPDVVPVAEGAGEVVATGPGVGRVEVGDRVAGHVFPDWIEDSFRPEYSAQLGGSLDGMLSEYVVLDERAVVRVPGHLSFEEAATLPCVGLTAWNALTGGRGLLPGETVLTLGSGGVSLFALQFARAAGARVMATTGSARKAERLRALGADHVVDYRSDPEWPERVLELTEGRGAEHIVEVAGTLNQSLRASAKPGELAFVGTLPGGIGATPVNLRLLFTSGAVVRPIAIGSRVQFEAMNRAIEAHRLRPVIDRVFPFEEAIEAYRYYAAGESFGKVVISSD